MFKTNLGVNLKKKKMMYYAFSKSGLIEEYINGSPLNKENRLFEVELIV